MQENKITVDGKDILIKSQVAKNKQYVLIDLANRNEARGIININVISKLYFTYS